MFKNILIALFVLVLLAGCGKTEKQQSGESTLYENTTISVSSIMCEMCVTTITDALNKVDGVNNVDVNLAGKVAVVKFNPSKVDMKGLEKVILNAGYDANETPRNREAYENLPECCKDGK